MFNVYCFKKSPFGIIAVNEHMTLQQTDFYKWRKAKPFTPEHIAANFVFIGTTTIGGGEIQSEYSNEQS